MNATVGDDNGPFWPSEAALASTGNATLSSPLSPDGTIAPGRRHTLPARQGAAVRVAEGSTLRIVNTYGTQVVDSWAFDAADLTEFMSMEHARAVMGRIGPRVGDSLATNRRRPILTLVEDTTDGIHDTFIAACDIWRYSGLGVEGYHDSCTDNLRLALRAIGEEAPEVPAPLNLFMNIPIGSDGGISWLAPTAKPGDHLALRAEMDAIIVLSACPQDMVPINGEAMTPRSVQIELTPPR